MIFATEMTTMTRFPNPFLCIFLLLGAFLLANHARAEDATLEPAGFGVSQPAACSSAAIPQSISITLFAGLTDGIVGNRSRMIQAAFVAFAIGVFILMTATRKH
jgi:hypothetical protein